MDDNSPQHPGFERSSLDEGFKVELKLAICTTRLNIKTHDPFAHHLQNYCTGTVAIPVSEVPALRTRQFRPLPLTPATKYYAAAADSGLPARSLDDNWMTPAFAITAPHGVTQTIPRVFDEETPLLRSVTPDPGVVSRMDSDVEVQIDRKANVQAEYEIGVSGEIEGGTCPDTDNLPKQPFIRTFRPLTIIGEDDDSEKYQTTLADIPEFVFEFFPDAKESREGVVTELECERAAETNLKADATNAASTHRATNDAVGSSDESESESESESGISVFDVYSGCCSRDSSCTCVGSYSNLSTINTPNKVNDANTDSPESSPQDPGVPVLTMTHADGTREYIPFHTTLLAEAQATVCGMSDVDMLVFSGSSFSPDDSGYVSWYESDEDAINLTSQDPDVLDQSSSDSEHGYQSNDGSSGGYDSQAHAETTTSLSKPSVCHIALEQDKDGSIERESPSERLVITAEVKHGINATELFHPAWRNAGMFSRNSAEILGLLDRNAWSIRAADNEDADAISMNDGRSLSGEDTIPSIFTDAETEDDEGADGKEENADGQPLIVLENNSEPTAAWCAEPSKVVMSPSGFAIHDEEGNFMSADFDFQDHLLSCHWGSKRRSTGQKNIEIWLQTHDDAESGCDQVMNQGYPDLDNSPHDHETPNVYCPTIEWIRDFIGFVCVPRHLPRRVHQLRGEWPGHLNVDEGSSLIGSDYRASRISRQRPSNALRGCLVCEEAGGAEEVE